LAFSLENFTSTRVLPVTQNLTLKLICLTIYIYGDANKRRPTAPTCTWTAMTTACSASPAETGQEFSIHQ
jgi:hypothetical protein